MVAGSSPAQGASCLFGSGISRTREQLQVLTNQALLASDGEPHRTRNAIYRRAFDGIPAVSCPMLAKGYRKCSPSVRNPTREAWPEAVQDERRQRIIAKMAGAVFLDDKKDGVVRSRPAARRLRRLIEPPLGFCRRRGEPSVYPRTSSSGAAPHPQTFPSAVSAILSGGLGKSTDRRDAHFSI